jgi:WD40 repeat protein
LLPLPLQDQVLQRCFTQEPLTALAASPNGLYLVGGGSSGSLYCWETASGKLLRSWPAHYKVYTVGFVVGLSGGLNQGVLLVSAAECTCFGLIV